jgi:hypothetical protein
MVAGCGKGIGDHGLAIRDGVAGDPNFGVRLIPMRELDGTVMQLEKYLLHLNRWGDQGQRVLNTRFASQLPAGVTLQIVAPSGMIIMSRHQDWHQDQRTAFEIIRNKYRHLLEIMTSDDLLRRLRTGHRLFQRPSPKKQIPSSQQHDRGVRYGCV